MRYVNGDDLDQDPHSFAQRDFNNGGFGGTSFNSEFLEYSGAIVPAATVASSPMSQEVMEIDWEAAKRGETAIGLKLTIDDKLLSLLNVPEAAENDAKAAFNFPALSIQIGSWERDSRYGEVVVRSYYKTKKLVWEINVGFKRKYRIVFNWSDIAKMETYIPLNGSGCLIIKLNKSPLFFIEEYSKPKKHTKWRTYSDFTNKQASTLQTHMLKIKQGVLEKYYHKLLIVDPENTSNTQPCRHRQDSKALCPTANILRFDESRRSTLSKDNTESDPASYVASNFTNHYIGGGINPALFNPLLLNQSTALPSDFGDLIDTGDSRLDAVSLPGLEISNQVHSYVPPPHPPVADTLQGPPSFVPDYESSSGVGHLRSNGYHNDLFDFQ